MGKRNTPGEERCTHPVKERKKERKEGRKKERKKWYGMVHTGNLENTKSGGGHREWPPAC